MSSSKKSSWLRAHWARIGLLLLLGAVLALACSVDDRSLDATARGGAAGHAGASGASGAGRGGSGTGQAGSGDLPEGGAGAGEGGSGGQSGDSSTGGGSGSGGSNGGKGGSSSNGGSSGNGGSGGSNGGTSGSGGGDEYGAGGCGDLDHDSVQDCEQTLANNSRFMTDASGWQAEPTLKQAWDQRNARPGQTSGALRVRNENVGEGMGVMLAGSRQCLPAVGGKEYVAAARTFIPSGQGAGSAGVAIWFYGSDDCQSNSIGSVTLQLISATDAWLLAEGKVQAPGGTRAMHVRLVTSKSFTQPAMEALFDDVLVREE